MAGSNAVTDLMTVASVTTYFLFISSTYLWRKSINKEKFVEVNMVEIEITWNTQIHYGAVPLLHKQMGWVGQYSNVLMISYVGGVAVLVASETF